MVKRKLARGLQSLLGVAEDDLTGEMGALVVDDDLASEHPLREVPLALIDPNPYQPRKSMEGDDLVQLAQSIKLHGVIQPILLRPMGDRFQIVAGERRFRAAAEVGHTAIPARVIPLDDQHVWELALIENLQRRDLNAMEKAEAFEGYIARFQTTHEELASQLGVDRTTVTNLIRLLDLPAAVQEAVRVGQISLGHAKALLSIADPVEQVTACRRVIAEQLSVRQTEELVRQQRTGEPQPAPKKEAAPKSNHILSLESDLRQCLGTKVEIKPKSNSKGVITIHFETNDDFERVLGKLGISAAA